MMGGKRGSEGGVETEASDAEMQLVGDLPPASNEVGDVAERPSVRAAGAQLRRGLRVLLVVDDPDLGDWLLEEFKHVGCAVALATCGKEGLQFLRSCTVDIVISEMGLPDFPGMDLLRELRALPKMPKIILTANRHSSIWATRAIENGASEVLSKPFRMEQLFAAIVRSLAN